MDKKSENLFLRAAGRYFLLQLPGQIFFLLLLILIRRWIAFSDYLMWGLPAIWIGKDIVLFPFLWRYYATDPSADSSRMVGRMGVALSRLAPDGHVRVGGERWRASIAEGASPIEKGQAICVDAIDGLRLTVGICTDEAENHIQPGGHFPTN
jgi:membrane protein implicated in regulation of membrane protease activity